MDIISKMVREFISANRIYKLNYPNKWVWSVDSESKGDTLMFFDKESGIGTLRVTAITIKGKNANAASIIKNYKKKYKNSKFFDNNKITYLIFIEETIQDNVPLKMYWWYIAKEDRLIIFSFTIEKKYDQSKKVNEELKIVNDIIKSVTIL